MRMHCWLFHDWGPWGGEYVTLRYGDYGSWTLSQRRRCERCGKTKQRRVGDASAQDLKRHQPQYALMKK